MDEEARSSNVKDVEGALEMAVPGARVVGQLPPSGSSIQQDYDDTPPPALPARLPSSTHVQAATAEHGMLVEEVKRAGDDYGRQRGLSVVVQWQS